MPDEERHGLDRDAPSSQKCSTSAADLFNVGKKSKQTEQGINEGDAIMSVEQDLRSILGKWKKDDTPPLMASTKLGDLNIDSLDLVEVMFEIEEKFDVSLMQSHQEARDASFADLSGWIDQQLLLQRNGAKPAITLRGDASQPQ